ncbi:MAG: 3-hydroxyacyl-CoA dehydrogenase family protein [Pirellulales bacterium]
MNHHQVECGFDSTTTVAVVGLGLLGRGIAACLLGHGLRVVGFSRSNETHDVARRYIDEAIRELIEHAGFDSSLEEHWIERFTPAQDIEAIRGCDLVIESIDEDLLVKHAVFDRIESVIRNTVPVASNTSALPISVLQQGRRHPERFVGMHWAQPCHATQFLEIIRGDQTSDEAVRFVASFGRCVGKEPSIILKDVPGFIANRLGYAVHREALHLLEMGVADVETIDRSYRNAVGIWATLCGPFRWMDLNGGPALYAKAESAVVAELSTSRELSPIMKKLADEGSRGIVNGRGFYNYTKEEAEDWTKRLHERVWAIRRLTSPPIATGTDSRG